MKTTVPSEAEQVCACDPRHLEVGGFDPDCPKHSS